MGSCVSYCDLHVLVVGVGGETYSRCGSWVSSTSSGVGVAAGVSGVEAAAGSYTAFARTWVAEQRAARRQDIVVIFMVKLLASDGRCKVRKKSQNESWC